eukprot:1188958-Prorocentrum_minimum.AAC.4
MEHDGSDGSDGSCRYKLQEYYLDEFLDLIAGKGKVAVGMQRPSVQATKRVSDQACERPSVRATKRASDQ